MRDEAFYEGANRISVDILVRTTAKVGPGPLATCLDLTCDTLLSQAGTFTARFPANDQRTNLVQVKTHLLDFYADGEFVMRGIVEAIEMSLDNTGQRIITISGRDFLAELDELVPVSFDSSFDGTATNTVAFELIDQFNVYHASFFLDPTEWAAISPYSTDTLVYASFRGLSTLKMLQHVGVQINEAFRLADYYPEPTLRHLEWLGGSIEDSGVRAIQGASDAVKAESNPHICFIQNLTVRENGTGMVTGVFAFGSGFGDTRLDTGGTNVTFFAPYSQGPFFQYFLITNTNAQLDIGKSIVKSIWFKDIRPIFNTDADIQTAKDYLATAALNYLRRNDGSVDFTEYELDVIQLPRHVKVGMSIRVIYQDEYYDLDADLIVLGIRRVFGQSGEVSYRLTVSGSNQWRLNESSAIVSQMEESEVLSGHPQIDANTYWENFREEVGDSQTDHIAEFPFWLSAEVVTIRQVLFRYNVGRILTGTNSYAYDNANTDGSSAANTGNTVVTTDATSILIDGTTVTTDGTSILIDGTTVTVNPLTGGAVSESVVTTTDATSPDSFTETNHLGLATATQGALSSNPTNHSHDIGTHVHDFTHSHTTTTHSHIIDHGHSTNAHSHTNTAHLHTSDAHSHTNTAHLHTSTTHGHTMAHTHPMASLVATFGVTRVPALNSYVMADLEYSVNGGAWASLDLGTPVAGGYYELDITSEIQNPNGLRRPMQEYNLVEIRRKSSAGTGKSALIRAKLGIRATIQSIVTYA